MISSRGSMSQDEPEEIWLRGNVRPVVAAAAVVCGVAAIVFAVMTTMAVPPAGRWAAGIVGVGSLLGLAALAFVAGRPRLVHRGDHLLVRISPAAVAAIPLDVIECFFAGSNPLDAVGEPTCAEHAAFRVGTLVVRIAERAAGYRGRDTFRPWVVWDDGYVVIDGRWCEPLSPAKTRDLGGKLAAAKRTCGSRSTGG